MTRVLVVDDEAQLRRAHDVNLAACGYEVASAASGEEALTLAGVTPPDVVLLDLGLPGIDGLDVIRGLRAWSSVPIVVLSARDAESVKVAALDAGADDYITKPFGIDELLARVRAALRRSGSESEVEEIDAGDFRIDLGSRRVHARGQEVRLTPKEFELFVYMARHPSRVITHRTLLEAVWGEASQEQPEYLRVFMGQLRKKLEPDPSNPRYLVTEPWVGYRFNPRG